MAPLGYAARHDVETTPWGVWFEDCSLDVGSTFARGKGDC
jgi:hypothetical protein